MIYSTVLPTFRLLEAAALRGSGAWGILVDSVILWTCRIVRMGWTWVGLRRGVQGVTRESLMDSIGEWHSRWLWVAVTRWLRVICPSRPQCRKNKGRTTWRVSLHRWWLALARITTSPSQLTLILVSLTCWKMKRILINSYPDSLMPRGWKTSGSKTPKSAWSATSPSVTLWESIRSGIANGVQGRCVGIARKTNEFSRRRTKSSIGCVISATRKWIMKCCSKSTKMSSRPKLIK